MRYKNRGKASKSRELRKFYNVDVYIGDKDAKKPKTRRVTAIAFNEVDVARLCAAYDIAERPEYVCHVTWPENEGEPVYRIDNATDGPTEEVMNAEFMLKDEWDD